MLRIIRKIFIPAATVAAIMGIGVLLHTPSPFVDAISGATRRVEAKEKPELEGKYIFVVNKESSVFKDARTRANVMEAVKKNAEGETFTQDMSFSIAVSEEDTALSEYTESLADALNKAGANVRVRKYPKTILRSRIPVGKYDSFIATRGFTDAEAVKNSEYIMLEAEGMRVE